MNRLAYSEMKNFFMLKILTINNKENKYRKIFAIGLKFASRSIRQDLTRKM